VPNDSRQQMILTAVRLFQRDGFHATSWRGLVKEADAPWGSVHHHFPGGKEELAAAAIDAGSQGVIAVIDHCFAQQPDPRSAVALWFEITTRSLIESAYQAGCPVATVALETSTSPGAVHDATASAFTAWERRLASHLRRAGATRAKAAETAVVVLALLEGAMLLSRVRGSVQPMRAASRSAQAVVAESCGSAATPN
jgi:TetR/AcrR family transcriptional repressor of lmrAB and yxaGH operons